LTLSLLKDLSNGVSGWISYQSREDEGTQSPAETLNRGWGSCRDFAVLFIEAARCLGFGARIVSGYRYNPTPNLMQSADARSTHAWAEIYVSGGLGGSPSIQRTGALAVSIRPPWPWRAKCAR
jgi:hypothetical protein